MIISNKSLVFRTSLFAAGLSIFLAGCTNPDETAGTTKTGTDTVAGGPTPETPTASTTNPGATSGAATLTYASIEPTIKARCAQCHTGPEAKEGYDFSSYATLMKGGEDGPTVKPNDPENSLIVQVITGSHGKKRMPPIGDPLTEEQITAVKEWIKAGAPG